MSDVLPAEKTETIDDRTGARVIRWTSSPAKDQHLYFTSPSVTDDDRYLMIISERTGDPNVFAIDRTTGELRQLSQNTNGLLHAYVYPYGGDLGLSKASPCLDGKSGRVVWIQDDALWETTVGDGDGAFVPRHVIDLPDGMVSGFNHVSTGGQYACVPVASPEAFEEKTERQGPQMRAAYRAFHNGGLVSRILVIDIEAGQQLDELVMPFWVTHVVFAPNDPSRIVFNQEGGMIASQRTWRWQREAPGIPATELGGRPLSIVSADEYLTHENYDPTGRFVLAHGGSRKTDDRFFEKREWDGRLVERVYPKKFKVVGHAVAGTDGVTVLCDPKDGLWAWNSKTDEPRLLCEHGSSACEQDCHVHPVMTPDGQGVTFTSDRDGVANVYEWRAD